MNLLARLPGLKVAARASSFAFKGKSEDVKEIGRTLDVATVLEGSVRKSNTTLRITAQLIDAGSGFHRWSHTYDRELPDCPVPRCSTFQRPASRHGDLGQPAAVGPA